MAEWTAAAKALGVEDMRHISAIPLDARHRSKTDHGALEHKLESG